MLKNISEKFKRETSAKTKFWRKFTIYLLALVLPIAYIYFLSDTNYARHAMLRQKINQVETENNKLRGYLENAHTPEEIRKSPALMEQHVREQLNMKRADEDIFIIETIDEDQNN